ncbi:site-specific integrase [Phyllobacterium sp. NPDC097923]|uniref:site-specific integrase n=1 Tax=Phyllobacterium sp. NPDC097923 TaxID=3364404 RepID=UPI00383AE880
MPGPNAIAMTLEDLRGHIAVSTTLPETLRTDLRSKLKRFADVLGKHCSEIIADPVTVRVWAAKANWVLAGLSKNTWANILSAVTRAMKIAGIAVHRRRRNFKLSLKWEELLSTMNRRDKDELHRFAGWCSPLQIAPEAVDPDTFHRYLDYLLAETIQTNPKERWHVARRAWNRAAAAREDASFPFITDVVPTGWRGLKWSDFPQTLQRELEEYRKKVLAGDIFSDDGGRSIKPITVDGYLDKLRWYLSRLLETGVALEILSSISNCVRIDLVKAGLTAHLNGRVLDDRTRPGLHGMMTAVLSVARYANVPDDQIDVLKQLARRVRHRPNGMTVKNRERIAQFTDVRAKRSFITLPFKVADELMHVTQPTIREAQRMQFAALHALLLHLPIRIKNAATLDLDKHIQRPVGKNGGRWRIHFEAAEVKNAKPIDAELNEETSALLERYVAVFRPRLFKFPTSRFFIGQAGIPKDPGVLSKQFASFVKRESGFAVNAHLMRHFAAFTFLGANPGQYETVRQLLGHKNIMTTVSFYAGTETKTAFERYDQVLSKLVHGNAGFVFEDKQ